MENDEIEVENEVNPMDAFINDITAKNYTAAQDAFNGMIGDKLADALEAEKIKLAQGVYDGEEEQLELPLEDEEGEEPTEESDTSEEN